MEHFVTIYNEKNTVNNTRTNHFFDNKNSYNLKKIYSKENFILTSNKFGKNFFAAGCKWILKNLEIFLKDI